jgi:hypothetical protein
LSMSPATPSTYSEVHISHLPDRPLNLLSLTFVFRKSLYNIITRRLLKSQHCF